MIDSLPPSHFPEIFCGLEQLLELAGEQLGEEISPRTVRLYATQGLIDRPGKEGRSAVYGRRHLLQLLLIRSLARRGLSLAAIAPLCGLPDPELAQQLAHLDAASEASPGGSPPLSSSQQEPENQAMAFLQQLKKEDDLSSSLDSRSLLPLLGSPLSPRSSRFSPSRSPSRGPSRSGGSREAASRWHRFTLAPGVELQISESVSIPPSGSRRMAWINRLVARLIEQLEDGPS